MGKLAWMQGEETHLSQRQFIRAWAGMADGNAAAEWCRDEADALA
jgi:hypothetical protein